MTSSLNEPTSGRVAALMAESTWRRAGRHVLFLTVGVVVARLVNFVTVTLIAKALGPPAFAAFSFVLTLFIAFSLIANLGLENLLVREVARTPEGASRLMGRAILLRTLSLPAGLALVLVIGWYDPTLSAITWWMWLYGQLHAELLFLYAIFRGLEQMSRQMLLVSLQAVAIAVGTILVLWQRPSPTTVAAAHGLGTILPVLAGWLWIRQTSIRPRLVWEPEALRALLLTTLPFALSIAGLLIFDRQSVLFVELLTTREALGWYNAVYLIILALSQLPLILINALFPLVAQRVRDRQPVARLVLRAWLGLTAVGIACAVGLLVVAPWLVPLLFGDAYQPAAAILQRLALSLPFVFWIVLFNGILQAVDHQRRAALAFGLGLLAALPLTGLLTVHGGTLGGAWGYTLSALILALLLAAFTWQRLRTPAPTLAKEPR